MKDNTVAIAYYGAAAFKLTTATGKKILIDPYITQNPVCSRKLDYFYDVDLILVSHGSFDHLGDTIPIMKESNAVLIGGADVSRYALEKGIPRERVKRTIYGDTKEFEDIRVQSVYARHISTVEGEKETYYGTPMGFVINTENNIRIYHAGDTSLFGDLKIIGTLYRPNIFLVGVGSVSKGFAVEMSPNEAAMAALWVAPDVAIPMHYPPGADNPVRFREALRIVAPEVAPILMEPDSEITYRRYQVD